MSELVALKATVDQLRKRVEYLVAANEGDVQRELKGASDCMRHAVAHLREARDAERARDKGNYAVVRWCCSSGNCVACWELPLRQRVRVTQLDGLSKARAEEVAENFATYGAEVVED